MPSVSVIITTSGRPHLVGEAIESVLAQTFRDFEIIVVHKWDASPQTLTALSRYESMISRVRQSRPGLSAARNCGIQAACGEYIGFLDDDDVWEPDKLEKQVHNLRRDSAIGLTYGDMRYFGEIQGLINDTCFGDRPPPIVHDDTSRRQLMYYNYIPGGTVAVRRTCLDEVGWFDESLTAAEDYDLWLRINSCLHWQIDRVPEVLSNYRFHGSNMSNKYERMMVNVIRVKQRALARQTGHPPLTHEELDRYYYQLYRELAWYYCTTGDIDKAHELLLVCREQQPECSLYEVTGSPFAMANEYMLRESPLTIIT